MPDYFDRLLARYTPVPAAGGGAARVRQIGRAHV